MSVSKKRRGEERQNLCPLYDLTVEVSLLSHSIGQDNHKPTQIQG